MQIKEIQVFIHNCSAADFASGNFPDPGPEAVAIQITDPCIPAPVSSFQFESTHHFEFCDVESETEVCGEFAITREQAEQIARILLCGVNVIVHCHHGIFRSGGVAAAAEVAGFDVPANMIGCNERVYRLVADAIRSEAP